MPRRLVPVLLIPLLVAPIALATGVLGGDAPTRIPVPARVFRGTVTDQSGVVVELTRVTFDGEVFVTGSVGEGQAAVPFERIDELMVEPTGDAGSRLLFIKLVDGAFARVVVERDEPLFGEAVFGNYRIEVGDLRRLDLTHIVP